MHVEATKENVSCLYDSDNSSYILYILISGDGSVICVRWNDNSVVTLLSNWQGIEPMQSAKRFSTKEKKKIGIQQPFLISEYNKGNKIIFFLKIRYFITNGI